LIESNLALPKNVKFICRVIPTMTQTIWRLFGRGYTLYSLVKCSDRTVHDVLFRRAGTFQRYRSKDDHTLAQKVGNRAYYHDGGHHGRSGWYYAQDINGACHNVLTAQVLQVMKVIRRRGANHSDVIWYGRKLTIVAATSLAYSSQLSRPSHNLDALENHVHRNIPSISFVGNEA
jgi:hypothetical protein